MAVVWTPSQDQILNSNLKKFTEFVEENTGKHFKSYDELHHFSISNPEFWRFIIEFCKVEGEWNGPIYEGENIFSAQWFPQSKLNFAENMLKNRSDDEALIFRCEDRISKTLSFAELYNQVSKTAQHLKELGVTKGDRVAGFLPNFAGSIVAMLATASVGAIWSSCSPDFGEQGVIDRFGQIEPKVLFCVDGYFYNGKTHNCLDKIKSFTARLPSLKQVVIFDYASLSNIVINNSISYQEILENYEAIEIGFERVGFDHPLYIMYSSGTTGVPKCIVHGHGGTLVQHLKEHQLQTNISSGDRVFYFTTCSWMMWNWLVSALGTGATIMLYDGSPTYPDNTVLWQFADEEEFSHFGTSAKYIETLMKDDVNPSAIFKLSNLKVICSTGSPLSAECYDYIYNNVGYVHLASISGGTDIVSCFVLGVPNIPVRRGEIQGAGLGMAVEIWDDSGRVNRGERGELVCTKPFPSRPVKFWNDIDGRKYHAAYFDRFEGVWAHGDFAEQTPDGGYIIYGRSDATLNPGGVRIGTAEIYRQVDRVKEVLESIVIGQIWESDTRIVLFVKLREGINLTETLADTIKKLIKNNCTSRHVPSKILQVEDIPRTKSGKIVEIPVRDIVHGREVKNKEALANPEALDYFKDRPELALE
ncbi:MAG: acetoacetate--CoA ligase [Marinovum sp.]|nr:acetoacetate--CoA ligase [Marinovum sp.]MAP82137.1 acetoacetate--CoA ligase [Marinovum sp.]|tara:strand:- start:402 stop:2336 length:1935 start_codon:yes stop_codon:yes gene_type:complete